MAADSACSTVRTSPVFPAAVPDEVFLLSTSTNPTFPLTYIPLFLNESGYAQFSSFLPMRAVVPSAFGQGCERSRLLLFSMSMLSLDLVEWLYAVRYSLEHFFRDVMPGKW
jgi:hypothetical protein